MASHCCQHIVQSHDITEQLFLPDLKIAALQLVVTVALLNPPLRPTR